jgi:hypothetical protein
MSIHIREALMMGVVKRPPKMDMREEEFKVKS